MPNSATVTSLRDHHGLAISFTGLGPQAGKTPGESGTALALVEELRELRSPAAELAGWRDETWQAVPSPAKSLDQLLEEVSLLATTFDA